LPLRVLHLSDIHFHDLERTWDPDGGLRDDLSRDLRQIVLDDGPIDVVLVGGDIAFSAKAPEYEIATDWLADVREACGGLPESKVWVIPGNHDVDRDTIAKSVDAQDFRQSIGDATIHGIDEVIRRSLSNDPAGSALMIPLAAYNDFAAKFGCTTTASSLMWRDFTLDVDGLPVCLTGINSALVSEPGDSLGSLVVGTRQCELPRAEARVHIAMLHHPPAWLRDWTVVAPYLRRAHVLLFGHEHEFSAAQSIPGGTVQISAGAVAPERTDAGQQDPFLPSYSVLTLSRTEDGIDIDVLPRRWSIEGTRFELHPGGAIHFAVDLDPPYAVDMVENQADSANEVVAANASPLVEELVSANMTEGEAGDRANLRTIGLRYMQLPVLRRLEIAAKLGVFSDEDLDLPKHDLYPEMLRRIRTGDLIEELVGELDS